MPTESQNPEQTAEEVQGKIRWLRPGFQCLEGTAQQAELAIAGGDQRTEVRGQA